LDAENKKLTDMVLSMNVTVPDTHADQDNAEIVMKSLGSKQDMGLVSEDVIAQKYIVKMKAMKEEMDGHMRWELDKQKSYYEYEMARLAAASQTEMRERLMELQEALTTMSFEGEVNVGDVVNKIATTF
jgi:hypothetical protein